MQLEMISFNTVLDARAAAERLRSAVQVVQVGGTREIAIEMA